MTLISRALIVVVVLLLVGFGFWTVRLEFQKNEIVALHSCMTSSARALNEQQPRVQGLSNSKLLALTGDYAGELLRKASPGDCYKYSRANGLRDLWQEAFILQVRLTTDGRNDFVVVSKGPDRTYGTQDDIYSNRIPRF